MLEVSAGTVWQLKYMGYIFGCGTMTFGNSIPKSVLGERVALKKSTPYPMACGHQYQRAGLRVHQRREAVETCGTPGHARYAVPQQGSAGQHRAFLGPCSAAKETATGLL